MTCKLAGQNVPVTHDVRAGQNVQVTNSQITSLGGKRGVLALFITSADVSRRCWQASVRFDFLRSISTQGIANYLSSLESESGTFPYGRLVPSRFVEHLTNSSAVLHAVVQPSFSTAYYAHSVLFSVCQVLRDISCVNPSRTPKAFKGKGSALSQRVTSGLHSVSSAGLGAGA